MSQKYRKGQSSVEYLMLISVVAMILLPATYFFYNYSLDSSRKIDQGQLDATAKLIITTSERIYYFGSPSRILLEARLPAGIRNISTTRNPDGTVSLLIFNVSIPQQGITSFTYLSNIPLNGTFMGALEERSTSQGDKQINIEAYQTEPAEDGTVTTFTYVNFGGRCPRSLTYDYDQNGGITVEDGTFYANCYCDRPGHPKSRPTQVWKKGWFENSEAFPPIGDGPFAVCMNADYDADCDVDDDDSVFFCANTGWAGPPCTGPIVC